VSEIHEVSEVEEFVSIATRLVVVGDVTFLGLVITGLFLKLD